ncbi:MAG: hypothetical protein QG671_3043 [Actinomycetota bacterium]|nr:hypothetical protein [Actinomycetota bacterium]
MTTPTAASPTSALAADEGRPAADGLARPFDFDARYGAGATRGLVLGGGGIFFIAWQVAYLRELEARGLDLSEADIVVGTSAGSVVAGLLTGRRLRWFSTQLELLSKAPGLMSALAPASDLNPSQQRALNLFSGATDNRPETIHAIGYAALAADAAPAAKMRRSVAAALALRGWPSQALHISTVDTYTGERLILTSAAGVPATHAAAASSAVPGLFSPQPIKGRKCMDGGVSGSGIHSDVVSGAGRALILSLGAMSQMPVATMTIQPTSMADEVAALAANGTPALLRGPEPTDVSKLMSPAAVPEAIAMGRRQAAEQIGELLAFWHG